MMQIDRKVVLSTAIGFTIGYTLAYFPIISEIRLNYNLENRRFIKKMDALSKKEMAVASNTLYYHHSTENTTMAEKIYKKVRILCWIMTGPKNHEKKAKHVKATWGKRCDILLFMSSVADAKLPTVKLPIGEGRKNLWGKTKLAFKHIHQNYLDKADWFIKADDDTYVILENLINFLSDYHPNDPIYFGCKIKSYVDQGYMSGGAGYVLSRESVKRFVETALPNGKLCNETNSGAEDVEIGKCLANVNVTAEDTRDKDGRGRFLPFNPQKHLFSGGLDKDPWYYKNIFYKEAQGFEFNCCSDNVISFHYVTPNQMYEMEYLIYYLKRNEIT